ncbi:hypothetical protein [Limosilactobacillus panis]|uniref:Uncharacterized protein n=1 Tax=Limosilactobacillus panis DSM 6035 TaxID=1423782 RepID=A0A0R1XA27_9LACO|nr:hypothetical protein [Limosilactobacillus panis]KRM27063.1 hypothetical protein FD32_GL000161 [Limosilactobacillus panis DSM 6035]
MNNDIMETIASLKSIVETTQRQLMATVQENHDRAVDTLRMLSQVGPTAPTDRQAADTLEVKFPEEDDQHMTRAEYRKMMKHKK